ncbi:uncharacterized protein LOC128957487 [Oppia nitens]|uniref:uncharacterized protein LOC128957487 n=1 Tax=Oppia nitens TaxID=1686743 RepID=UPI0023DBD31D|nr:uncharacterized protein LOC128957487 [Oppia nitens]
MTSGGGSADNKTVITSITTSGHLLNTPSVKWSESNSIAVIIDKYLLVLTSRCDPTEWTTGFPYHKTVVPNPKQIMTFDCGMTVKEVLSTATLDEQQILMMDPSLAGETGNSLTYLSYRCIDWSPNWGELGCLLGALTVDHRLVIYRWTRDEWEQSIDVSELLNSKLQSDFWFADIGAAVNYNTYRDRMYSLATVCFCWARSWVETDDKLGYSCMLFMGSKNGLITFWDITVYNDCQSIRTQFLYKWTTNYNDIKCLKSFDDFLIISVANGIIAVIYTGSSSDSEPNPLLLWSEADEIAVNTFSIKLVDTETNTYDIVFAKSDFVVICRMNANIDGENIAMNLKCCKWEPGLHRMPATSISSIVDNKYLLTSLDGRLIEIEITHDLTIRQKEVTLDNISFTSMCSYGIDSSPNGVLSCLVQTLSPLHDHLVIKEPTQVIIFANLSFEGLTNLLYENFLSSKVIQLVKSQQFSDCFDYMDCVRYFLATNNFGNCETTLYQLICDQSLIDNCPDLTTLRIIRFITKVFITHFKNKTSDDCVKLEANAQLCEDMILKHFIHKLYSEVVCALEVLTESQLRSLKNMNHWLSVRFGEKLFADNCFDFSAVEDICLICGQRIEFDNRTTGACRQSHRFIRCANSLVLCDFVNYRYNKCCICLKSFVIKPAVWSKSAICLYCQ